MRKKGQRAEQVRAVIHLVYITACLSGLAAGKCKKKKKKKRQGEEGVRVTQLDTLLPLCFLFPCLLVLVNKKIHSRARAVSIERMVCPFFFVTTGVQKRHSLPPSTPLFKQEKGMGHQKRISHCPCFYLVVGYCIVEQT
ncbi:hypothetical protein F5H01DRAFT_163324 [Linnemannia elongata]|nr:hypothetical protein F5H01DRAFT_163324 [Linnemannia elongata]